MTVGCQPAALPPGATAPPAAAASSAELHITRAEGAIEVRRGAALIQRLDIPASAEAPELESLDLDFDGTSDIRVVDVRPAGPNVTYVNWLYDKASGRFVRSAALDALVAPQFDALRREVRSSWRDGATRYSSETYTFSAGRLQPLTRETREYSEPGVYTLQRLRWTEGTWQLVETVQGRGE